MLCIHTVLSVEKERWMQQNQLNPSKIRISFINKEMKSVTHKIKVKVIQFTKDSCFIFKILMSTILLYSTSNRT